MTRLANPCMLSDSRTEPPIQEGGDGAKDGDGNVRTVPDSSSGELPLSLAERILLVVGISIACVLIAFVDRPSTGRLRGKMARSKIGVHEYLPTGDWP